MKNEGVKFGLIYGVFSILTLLIGYFIDPKYFFDISLWRTLLGFAVMGLIMFYAAKKTRDRKGGYIPFGEAFIPAFLTYIIGGLIGVFFMYLMVNFIDPSLEQVAADATQEVQKNMYEMMGMTEDQMLEAMEEAEKNQPMGQGFNLLPLTLSFLGNALIMGLPIAAIIAAIVKKKEPLPVV